MKVSLLDLKAEYAGLRDEILPALDRVCQHSAFIQGEEVDAFEPISRGAHCSSASRFR
jgi:hypothetical protein